MSQNRTPIIAVAASLAVTAAAHAGPFDPPYRGEPNSVHAQFDWVDNMGSPWTVTTFETVGTQYPLDMMEPSGSSGDTDAAFILPNFIDELPLKYMRLQLSFDGAVDIELVDFDILAHDPITPAVIETGRGGVTRGGDGTFSNVVYIDYEIRPNPDWEELLFFGDVSGNIVPGNFLRLEIDTISIPAPMSACPLALVGAIALRRRRR